MYTLENGHGYPNWVKLSVKGYFIFHILGLRVAPKVNPWDNFKIPLKLRGRQTCGEIHVVGTKKFAKWILRVLIMESGNASFNENAFFHFNDD